MEGGATSSIRRQPPPEEPPKTDGSTSPTSDSGTELFSEEPELRRIYSDLPLAQSAPHPSLWGIEISGTTEISSNYPPVLPEVPEDNESDQEWRKELSNDLNDRWQGLSNYLNDSLPYQPSNSSCTIFKAPAYMKNGDDKTYAPAVVAIGPFHFSEGRWASPLHEHKNDCVSYLLARHESNEMAAELRERCIDLVLKLEPRARSCYSMEHGHKIDRHELAEMLLQDGCFILRLLLKQKKGESQEVDTKYMSKLKKWEIEITVAPMIGRLWIWDLVVYDLIKLENQIPFFVLQELFDILRTPADKDIDLVELALELFSRIYPARTKTFQRPQSKDVLHLLHLFHSSLIPPKSECTTVAESPDWIPSVTVLQDAGIRFRPPNKRTTESFLKVKFENGVMEIPPLQVDDCTSLVFRNLIAFEQCYPNAETHITTYVRFMDDLINTTKDVQLLSLDGVLLNRLGNEEAAADLLNKLCDQVHYSPDRNYLRKVITDVTEYYETPWHKWRAALFYKYFSSPWAIISVLAAVVLLLLTIEQAIFAGLSYFRPPS